MANVRLRPSAERDFVEIGDYTREKWSEQQAQIYLQTLLQTIRRIGEHPLSGRPLGGVRTDYRSRRSGSHLIFYIVKADGSVEVVRILHEKVDIRRHLQDPK
ncbi:type II toxin-antitoxin system RelE/ParE family toxin [Rhizobium panacihumi]|uniref:type II toxin-antitoxin system RelE/ParE family toxin n=1 Tax=Rhizobium panacihumi TaxID=2008450 RepID=UPI003D790CE3